MKDASLALLEGIRAALIADADVYALVGERIASSWANTMSPPFIRLSVPVVTQFEADSDQGSEDGSETSVKVHIWTKEPAPLILHDLASKIRDALQDNEAMAVDDADLWMLAYAGTIKRADADDPALQMAVVSFTAFTTTA